RIAASRSAFDGLGLPNTSGAACSGRCVNCIVTVVRRSLPVPWTGTHTFTVPLAPGNGVAPGGSAPMRTPGSGTNVSPREAGSFVSADGQNVSGASTHADPR